MTGHLGGRLCPLVDGQLRHDDRDRALAHLAHCSSCRRQVAEYRRMKQRLAGLWEPALPDQLADRLRGLGVGLTDAGPAEGRAPDDLGVVAGRRAAVLTQPRMPMVGAARAVAFGPPARQRLVLVGPPGRADRAAPAGGIARPGRVPLLAGGLVRPARRSRVRRTLISSAALMVLTVTGAAASDHASVAGGSSPTVRPSAPASQLPVANGGRPTPQIAPVSYAQRP
ncbi:zf-HC2 domain-containing protein [Pseudofrankia sp. DC12]|uniref:anti-sigma factor family protein n=1 Tax=Pseudofrankia sp. DC12 TaxID=683315 RepID=UPI000AC20CE5|nr:zf-HC2 domain-containing protein [Pseudofrankia sp. DC12]